MAKRISDILIKIKGDYKHFDKAISGAGISMKRLKGFATGVISSLVKIGAVGVTAMAGLTYAAWRITDSVKNYGVELDKAMKITGLGAQTISSLAYAAEQEHASLEDLQTGWRRLSKAMLDADEGLAEAKRTFDNIGISIYTSSGQLKSIDKITLEVADAFKSMTDDTKKAALAQELFGRSGMNLIPFLEMGSKGIKSLSKESITLGNIWTDEMAQSAKRFDDKLTALKYSFRAMKWEIGNALMPEFEKVLDWLSTNRDWIITTFEDIFRFDVEGFGEAVITELDNIKKWIENNKQSFQDMVDVIKYIVEVGQEAREYRHKIIKKTTIEPWETAPYMYEGKEAYELPKWWIDLYESDIYQKRAPEPKQMNVSIQLNAEAVKQFLMGGVVSTTNLAIERNS